MAMAYWTICERSNIPTIEIQSTHRDFSSFADLQVNSILLKLYWK